MKSETSNIRNIKRIVLTGAESTLKNYPGFSEGISGKGLIDRLIEQCKEVVVEIYQFEKVTNLNFEGKKKIVEIDKSKYTPNAIVIVQESILT